MVLLDASKKSAIFSRASPVFPDTLTADLPDVLLRVYRARGLTSNAELELGLDQLPTPDSLSGISAGVDLLCRALEEDWSILIVGDYDADGATSTTLMLLALDAMGFGQVDFLVPNRFEYGYGLTPEIVELAAERSPELIITVDNGISSIQGVAAAKQQGMHVLVTDHHLPGADLPAADAIVNPNQAACTFPGKHLAGVGVAFYVLSALRSRLRAEGWFEGEGGRALPNMAAWLDLVALGTVADVVSLDQINRTLVQQGLRRIQAGRARPGILALMDIANRDHRRAIAADLGFAVGPRLNAAGRLEDMSLGIRCLLEEDPHKAQSLALQLDELNRDRRLIEADMQETALDYLAALDLGVEQIPGGVCLFDAQWHQGVVGLLASRVKDHLHRPVIAFACVHTPAGDRPNKTSGELKGSGRSIPGFHMRDALDAIAARHPGLITRFGGHAAAAGLSLPAQHLEAFSAAFETIAGELLSPEDLERKIATDGSLKAGELNLDLACALREAGPWGQHFPEPCFYGDFKVVQWRIVAHRHLKFVLSPVEDTSCQVDAIAFHMVDDQDEDGQGSVLEVPEQISAVYRLDVNHYRGRETLQLMIEHLIL